MSTLLVIHKSLFSKLSTEDTLTLQLNLIEQTFSGTADFNRKVHATISRNGDLVHKMYLQTDLPAQTVGTGEYFKWCENPGHALIKNVEVEIGGQKIDKHYGDWLNIWSELTVGQDQKEGFEFDRMIG